MNIEEQIRKRQMEHEVFGPMYGRLYTFVDRTIDEFFWDVPDFPWPTLSMEKGRAGRAGHYEPVDALGVPHRINLNPFELRDGAQAAETLAHELLHMWEELTGQPTLDNVHSEEFNERMFSLFGIRTEGHDGRHTASDERWDEWLEKNADLNLSAIILPGSEKKVKRRMLKHTCPHCGATFHARKKMSVICGACCWKFHDVEDAKFLVDESKAK